MSGERPSLGSMIGGLAAVIGLATVIGTIVGFVSLVVWRVFLRPFGEMIGAF